MSNILTRIRKLEDGARVAQDGPSKIIIAFERDNGDFPIKGWCLSGGDELLVQRLPGETDEQLKARVHAAAREINGNIVIIQPMGTIS